MSDKCKRVIAPCKEEKPSFVSRFWWNKLFKALEAEAFIPPEKRLDILQQVFPEEFLSKIISLLSINESDQIRYRGATTNASKFPCEHSLIVQSLVPPEKFKPNKSESDNSLLTTDIDTESEKSSLNKIGKANPYVKFFNTRHDRASIWRPMPPMELGDMDLVQKADEITKRIAEDFVKWLHEMGGETTSILDVDTIIGMFEIGFNTHAAKSLCVRLKEMPTVTEQMAKRINVPQMAKRASLLRQINRDIAASRQKPRKVAFGRALPSYLQRSPNKEDIAKKWLECQNVPVKLKTMQTVWEGITHLRSTRAYCEWLVEHPEIKPPQYLLENNMLDRNQLFGTKFGEEDEALENAETKGGSADSVNDLPNKSSE